MRINKFLALILLCSIAWLGNLLAAGLPFPIGNANIQGLDDGSNQAEPLSSDKAFVLSPPIYTNNALFMSWVIAPEHYLYRERFKVRLLEAKGVQAGEVQLPSGQIKQDEAFGQIQAVHDRADITLPLQRPPNQAANFLLEVVWQGCNESLGVCHPPQRRGFRGQAAADSTDISVTEAELPSEEEANQLAEALLSPTTSPSKNASSPLPLGEGLAVRATPIGNTLPPPTNNASSSLPLEEGTGLRVSEEDQIAANLATGERYWTLLSLVGLGLLLAFTPCVFPMLPILSGIIVGQGEISTRRAFTLSLVYVLAMAFTYTLVGILAALFGSQLNLQAAFQNVWVLSAFSLVFVALALSMFGLYELQVPSALQSRLNALSHNQAGGTLVGVALMGIFSALIVGPCVAAPLMGVLIFIGQTGEVWFGGLALFCLSIGMGLPLLLAGTSAGKFLPKAGHWMNTIKAAFGVMLLGVAIWLLERVLPANISMLLWAALFIFTALFMGALSPVHLMQPARQKIWHGIAIMLLLQGVLIMIGGALGQHDILTPLKGLSANGSGNPNTQSSLVFTPVNNSQALTQQLQAAQGKQVVLDFYADWCISCKEMEKYTFSDPAVQQALQGVQLLKADVTANSAEHKALLQQFGLIGPPATLFFNASGQEIRSARLIGFVPSERFVQLVHSLK